GVGGSLEAGAIVRRLCESGGPAAFFEKVKDYPEARLLGAPMATYRRLAVALGLAASTHPLELLREYLRRLDSPIAARRVAGGPCQGNVRLGDAVDLFEFPAPMVHEGDGGRYIGTWHSVVTRDPEEGWVNWGMYRLMVFDQRNLSGRVHPNSDCGMMLRKYEAMGKPMPFAIVFGGEPVSSMAACASLRWGEDTAAAAGGIRGEALELVQCQTVDLAVPATAEIVLEGEVQPGAKLEEGPFGEYIGYRAGQRRLETAFHVNAVTFRHNPILPMTNMGIPTDEGQLIRAFTISASATRILEEAGAPLTGVWMWPESTHHTLVVSLKRGNEISREEVSDLIFRGKLGFWMHQLILVDDDVDVLNWKEVIHAFATRCHPVRDIRTFEGVTTSPIMPYLSAEEKSGTVGAKICFDCRWKGESPHKISFDAAYPRHIVERVLKNWRKYGFE
ncbi:MAG: UbiD family decarboxylase, partial [Chloroflexi bacterium]|nr:UbiD family decarboxylase [Chloroflexota bacterium]